MATTEFSTGKTVFVLAIVLGCVALLWPRIFHPTAHNSVPIPASPQNDLYAQNRPSSGCCDVVYDYDIDNNFFARLCEILVQREEGEGKKTKSEVQEKKPGVRQMCREKVLEMCQVDVGTVLNQDPKSAEYKRAIEEIRSLNVSSCLRRHYEKHEKFTLLAQKMRHRRFIKKQARSASVPRSALVHPAMRERGVPIATRIRESYSHKPKVQSVMPPRLATGHAAYPRPTPAVAVKGTTTGSVGFIMPMYTIGIVVFFIYTVMKCWKRVRDTALVMFRTRGEDSQNTISAFHADPDYRKYVLGQDYTGSAEILSYLDFQKRKDREEKLKYNIIQDDDRKLMFTAIQGIVAEMDEFREQIKKDENEAEVEAEAEAESIVANDVNQKTPITPIIPTISTTTDDVEDEEGTKQGSVESVESVASIAPAEILRDSLQAQMSLEDSDLLPTIHEDAKFAVLGVETTAVFDAPRSPTPGRSASPNPWARAPSPRPTVNVSARETSPPPTPRTPSPQEGDRESSLATPTPEMSLETRPAEFVLPENVPNILLETNFPSESQLIVSESQSETIGDDEEGGEVDGGVVIAGKMTISLIDMEANHVQSTSNLQGEGIEDQIDQINQKIDLLDTEHLTTPAAASEETTLEQITTLEEVVMETTTVTEHKLNPSNETKTEGEEEEEEESETETETSDESEENPTPPVPKDPLRNVQ